MAKQDQIMDDDLSIDKTDGLKSALDSTAKLASANTFTANQTVVGDLKGDYVLVKSTTPNLNYTRNLKIICRYCCE
jgi:hypothetical protein